MCLLIWCISEMIFPSCAYNSQLLVSLLCVCVCCLSGFGHRHCQHSQQTWTTNAIVCTVCVTVCGSVRCFPFVWTTVSVELLFGHVYAFSLLREPNSSYFYFIFLPKKIKTTTLEVTRNSFVLFVHFKNIFYCGGRGGGQKLEFGCRPCLTIPEKFLCVISLGECPTGGEMTCPRSCPCVSVSPCACLWMVVCVVCCWRCDPYLTVVFLFFQITPPTSFV